MAKIIEIFENATLVSVEQLADAPSYEWDWRCKLTGYNGTIYIGESQHKNPSKRFIMLTDNKNFRLTTSYGEIEQTAGYIKITTKSSSHIFLIE